MGYTLKDVKDNLYVYKEYKINGRVVTRYIGPLKKITRKWQAARVVNSNGAVNYQLHPRVLRKLESTLVKEVVNFLENRLGEWWTGRDLNPGPLGCQPSALPG